MNCKSLLAFILASFALFGFGCDDTVDPAGEEEDAGTTGALEIVGNWAGEQPEGVKFQVAVFECPFSMPPAYYKGDGTIDPDSGDVHSVVDGIEAGDWCAMAFIDMAQGDGLVPVEGLDAVNATGNENESGAFPVTIEAGETTTVDVAFEVQ